MKLINKDSLLKVLLNKRDSMYRQYDRLNQAIDNDCPNLDSKFSELSQISYGIDIITELIDLLDNFIFDLAEVRNNDIVVFNLCESVDETLTNTFEYLCSCGVSAVAMFNNENYMELDEKRNMINYLVRLLEELKGEQT
jgi:hypothetical protein